MVVVLGVVGFLQISKLINKLGVAAVETGARRRAQTKDRVEACRTASGPALRGAKGSTF